MVNKKNYKMCATENKLYLYLQQFGKKLIMGTYCHNCEDPFKRQIM